VVTRVQAEPVILLQYRCRDVTLFAGDELEWGWTPNRDEAWIFKHYDCGEPDHTDIATCATTHARKLKQSGESRCHAMTVNEAELKLRREQRELRDRDANDALQASLREPEIAETPRERVVKPITARVAQARRSARTRVNRARHVSPEECFENLERQHLA
jgi:hypothetical protein